ncbi:MAG: 16S rRNA (guanine(527)-N(7))-methyltransferase RsmG [Myxococcales bacterium]|nr:16S rRNA (guanine(527)-N(7))-methyltransferase RsmG [Myxococcales bacterium]
MAQSVSRAPLALPTVAPLAVPGDFVARAEALGVTLTPAMVADLGHYLALLLATNEQMNLTAVSTPEEAWSRHILDALTLVPLVKGVPAKGRVVDVGSGGGVPGIPLAIVRRDLVVTLIDATQKKAHFLRLVAKALRLDRVTVLAERAEAAQRGGFKGTADVVTARAVARLNLLVGWTLPFLKKGGRALLMKGQKADEELAEAATAIAQWGGAHRETLATDGGRVVVIERVG